MEFVEDVCLGKHHQTPFNSGKAWQAQNPLELIHNDLCCINQPSLVGAKYILTFIDDLSRFTWVYFLKNKSHVFEKFKEFRALTEKQCGQPIKCLRSDNGGEYVNHSLKNTLLDLVFPGRGCSSYSSTKWCSRKKEPDIGRNGSLVFCRPKICQLIFGMKLFTVPTIS
jgi:hypothetical protein